MRKNILLFVSLFTMSMLIISCGSDDDQPETEIVAEETDDEENEETDDENEETEPSQVLITSFEMDINDEGTNISGLVDNDSKTVVLQLPPGISTTFSPEITLSEENATINPTSGEELDFTEPVVYTVTTEDGTETVYEVFAEIAEEDTSGEVEILMEPTTYTTFHTSGSEDFEIINPAEINIDLYLKVNDEYYGYFDDEIITEYISVDEIYNKLSWTNKLPLGNNGITLGAYMPDTHTFVESSLEIINQFEEGVFEGVSEYDPYSISKNDLNVKFTFTSDGNIEMIAKDIEEEETGSYIVTADDNIKISITFPTDELVFKGKIINPQAEEELPYIEGVWKEKGYEDSDDKDFGTMLITLVEE